MRKKNTRGTRRRKLSQEQLERRELLAADLIEAVDLTTIEDDTVVAEVASLTAGGGGVNAPDLGSAGAETNPDHTTQATDVVLEWNELFNELLVADETNQNPGYASRAMAMLNLAIYDAVTIADGNPGDTFYDYDFGHGPRAPVIAEVAASQAAYSVLSSLYPDQQAMLDAFYAEVSAGYPGNAATAASVALGDEIAAVVIQARADDGWDAEVDYTYTDGAGNFQADPLNPDVPVWGPGWGEVETFSISSAENFAPETTPALTSEEYADSYNEVKELGSVDSTVRTADQTEAGIFWAYDREGLGTPLSLFNDVLQTVAVQQGNTLQENAALFAQASVAMADAAIVAWHTKFDEQFWRPVTAIHDGDNDGNELTEGDPDWTALGAPDGGDDIIGFTPQFPTYISGHATFGGALFGALQDFYGTDDIAFELTSKELEILLDDPDLQTEYGLELDDATRSFSSFSEAMAENGRSRVYLGIHFDFDDLVGQEVGQAVASAVASDFIVASGERGPGGDKPGFGRRHGPEDPRGPAVPNRPGPYGPPMLVRGRFADRVGHAMPGGGFDMPSPPDATDMGEEVAKDGPARGPQGKGERATPLMNRPMSPPIDPAAADGAFFAIGDTPARSPAGNVDRLEAGQRPTQPATPPPSHLGGPDVRDGLLAGGHGGEVDRVMAEIGGPDGPDAPPAEGGRLAPTPLGREVAATVADNHRGRRP